ncbi:MAG TPA: hypothetical protein VLT13_05670, partial [Bacteroidota bacterium]|nr:hypothetical protein [Bacteroidota bacterium]
WLFRLAREAGDRYFDPRTGLCLIGRDTLWYAAALLCDDREERRVFARDLIRTIRGGDGTHTPATMLALLRGLGDLLGEPERAHLRAAVEDELLRAAEVQWRDGNVNHPLGAYATLILGGELCGAPWATALGYRRLRELQTVTGDRRFRTHRQAELSEYNSLTYTALDLVFLGLIAEYAHDGQSRTLGLWLEQRLWLDVALRFHAPSMQFAGPHSRSYQEDSTGGFSALHGAVVAATGQPLYCDPSLSDRFDHPSTLLQSGLTGITPFHITEEALGFFREKPLPLLMRTTTYSEQYHENAAGPGFSFDDETYAGGWRDLTTFMNDEWALGTASLPYVNAGHADSVMIRIRRAEQIASARDFRSLYTRGVFNGATVGQRNRCHVTGGEIDASYLYEESRCAVYQHENRAIVFAAPKRAGHRSIRSFRLDLIAGGAAPFDRLVVGGRPVDRLPVEADAGARVCFQDYRTYGLIIPLTLVPAAEPHPLRIRAANGHIMLSLYNYDGPEQDFLRDELTMWRNGFILHLSRAEEWKTFTEFQEWSKAVRVRDSFSESRVREVIYECPDGTMRAVYDPWREIFRARTWNGADEDLAHCEIRGGSAGQPLLNPMTLFGSEALGR